MDANQAKFGCTRNQKGSCKYEDRQTIHEKKFKNG